jgi:class 3 adenylate cyclase/TolB-like protein
MNYSDAKNFVTGERVERRLAAILVADVAGYSRLMHTNEEATHARVTALLTDVVMPAIAEHGGRVVKFTGDGLLADFPSAVEAVRSAMAFQDSIYDVSRDDARDWQILFRVGIHVGDVIVGAEDIFGDGVNIASRLEGIAQAGGICLSSSAYDQVCDKIGTGFADLGEQCLKNIDRPVRVYAVIPDGPNSATQIGMTPRPLPAPQLFLVLPLANIPDDQDQDDSVDGAAGGLTADLSRRRGSFVIARDSAFAYTGQLNSLRQIGRELKASHMLEGWVQRSGDRLRINVQLIDAETGHWPLAPEGS